MALYKDGTLVASTNVTGDTLPIGGMIPWTSNTIPDNWLLCDGQAVSRTTYASLFAVVGTTYGVGDNSTTFNLPNIKGRTIVGRDSADTDFDVLGETRGAKTHTLATTEMPSHTHEYSNKYGNVNTGSTWASVSTYNNAQAPSAASVSTQVRGGDTPHNNIQPSIVENYIIKAQQSSGVVATVVDNLTSTSTTNALSANQGKVLNDKELVLLYDGAGVFPTAINTNANAPLTDTSANYKELIFVIGQNANECYVETIPVGYTSKTIFSYMAVATYYARGYIGFSGTTAYINVREYSGYALSGIGILKVYGRKC